ncbi:MAG: nucleotidyltransferase domain-containing protein [Planctomycetota bacterium]|nr:nucleotidyltransferase domain-containing protein [Planctomycetota bacterium]
MTPVQQEILGRLAENRAALQRLGVRRLGLFGSAAGGGATKPRDLDFLVELQNKTFDAYMDVKALLEELFDRPVDLVLADALKPALRERILRETVYAPGF